MGRGSLSLQNRWARLGIPCSIVLVLGAVVVSAIWTSERGVLREEVRRQVCGEALAIEELQATPLVSMREAHPREALGSAFSRIARELRLSLQGGWEHDQEVSVRDQVLSWKERAAHSGDGELAWLIHRASLAPLSDQVTAVTHSSVCQKVEKAEKSTQAFLDSMEVSRRMKKRQEQAARLPRVLEALARDLEVWCLAQNSEQLFREQLAIPYRNVERLGVLQAQVQGGLARERLKVEEAFRTRWGSWVATSGLNPCQATPRVMTSTPARSLSGGLQVRRRKGLRKLDILSESEPADTFPKLVLSGRRSARGLGSAAGEPHDVRDASIRSPKSVHFGSEGDQVYLQALEGASTLVFGANGVLKESSIQHRFDSRSLALFAGERVRSPSSKGDPFRFEGKPVEAETTHEGRFLWVPYYRKSDDPLGQRPSAMAIIETGTHQIRRVVETGSIAKGVRVSPDGKWLAVSHWGDNTVGLWNIEGDDPFRFRLASLLEVAPPLDLKKVKGNRDHDCGVCVRGLSFSKDSRTLWVGAMKGGFLASFDLDGVRSHAAGGPTADARLLPSEKFEGLIKSPRDLQLSPDGRWLYLSSASNGEIVRVATSDLDRGKNRPIRTPQSISLGGGVRSIRLSSDGSWLFAAVHGRSEVAVVDARGETLRKVSGIATDPFPVGLDLSPDGRWLWVTAQGVHGRGGDSASIYWVLYPEGVSTLALQPLAPGLLEGFRR